MGKLPEANVSWQEAAEHLHYFDEDGPAAHADFGIAGLFRADATDAMRWSAGALFQ
jgi:hypothetical protein